jgi:hypothetical protein
MEGTFCHSNKKPFLLYEGMLAPKDVLQFSGSSCTFEGMTLKLGAPGEHAFPRHNYQNWHNCILILMAIATMEKKSVLQLAL